MFSLNVGELFFVLQVTEETKTTKRRHINSSGNCSELVHSKKETPTEKSFSTEKKKMFILTSQPLSLETTDLVTKENLLTRKIDV